MLRITKIERDYLVNECGVNMGEDGISRTLGGTYYMTESKKNMSLLKKYRDSITICTVK